MPVIKFNQKYPVDLLAMKPVDYDAPDNIGVPAMPDNTSHAFDPDEINKKDLWQQRLLQLKDIPGETWWGNAGKSLIVNRSGEPSDKNYVVEFAYPDRLETPRDFSISGDGTADAVAFDGTANVNLQLKDVTAIKLKTARDFSIAGAVVAVAVQFDGQGNVILQTSYNDVIPDDKLPSWITDSFTAINVRLDQIDIDISNLDSSITAVDNRVTSINNSTQIQISNLGQSITNVDNRVTNIDGTTQAQITGLNNRVTALETAAPVLPVHGVGTYAIIRYNANQTAGTEVTAPGDSSFTFSDVAGTQGTGTVPIGQVWRSISNTVASGTTDPDPAATSLWVRTA